MISSISLHYLHLLDARMAETAVFNEVREALRKAKTEEQKWRIVNNHTPRLEAAMKRVLKELEAFRPVQPEEPATNPPPAKEPEAKFGLLNHPERQRGEVFVGIFTKFAAGASNYATKREGIPFQDGLGEKPSEDVLVPVFISVREAESRGLI